jgi:23S rRNA (adenine2503-C2)-methyltransferase
MNGLDLRDLDLAEMEKLMEELGAEPYRARQLFAWVHGRGKQDFEEMTDLPKSLRQKLAERGYVSRLEEEQCRASGDGLTKKSLLRLEDGERIETVVMAFWRRRARDRITACVSTQVGCSLKCAFCATGASGFSRNLRAGEIVGQVYYWNEQVRAELSEGRVTNVVYMGMGEPLLNLEAVKKSIRILTHPLGLNLGVRRITVSTCGIVPGIYRLAEEGLPVRLAVSLHSSDDHLRSELVPINRRYPLHELLAACRYYALRTGRKVTFAYLLLDNVNDAPAHARRLGRLLKGIPCQVNLIPLNPVSGKGYRRPSPQKVRAFWQMLCASGVEASIREERGADIEAACGQLRARGTEWS